MSKIVNQENLAIFAQQLTDRLKADIGLVVEEAIEGYVAEAITNGLTSKADKIHTHTNLDSLDVANDLACKTFKIDGKNLTIGTVAPENPSIGDVFIQV